MFFLIKIKKKNSFLIALVLAIGKNLERNIVTRISHEVIDPACRDLSHALALSCKEKGNKRKRTN
jgi:hypothetical protein